MPTGRRIGGFFASSVSANTFANAAGGFAALAMMRSR